MFDKVAEDVAVITMASSRVKLAMMHACGSIKECESCGVKVSSDNNVEGGKVGYALLHNASGVRDNLYSGIQLLYFPTRGLGAVLTDGLLGQEKLGAQVGLGDVLIIKQGQRPDAGEDQILGDLISQGLHGDEKNISRLNLSLRLYAPEPNLAVV